jgi:alpha-1,4-digalacturonate transport system permease protein
MVVLLSTISSMKEFAMIQALNGGGPGSQNMLMVQYIYQTGFERARIGYASAVSMVLMVILLIVAAIQLRFDKGGDR